MRRATTGRAAERFHYFQPPDARLGLASDVSDVRFVAFAPQEKIERQAAWRSASSSW